MNRQDIITLLTKFGWESVSEFKFRLGKYQIDVEGWDFHFIHDKTRGFMVRDLEKIHNSFWVTEEEIVNKSTLVMFFLQAFPLFDEGLVVEDREPEWVNGE